MKVSIWSCHYRSIATMGSSYPRSYLFWQMLCYNSTASIRKAFFVSLEMQKKWPTWYVRKRDVSWQGRLTRIETLKYSAFALRMATTTHAVSRIPMFPHHYSNIGYVTLKSHWLLQSTMTNVSNVPRILRKRLLSWMHYLKWTDVLSCTWLLLYRLVFSMTRSGDDDMLLLLCCCCIHMNKWLIMWYVSFIGL